MQNPSIGRIVLYVLSAKDCEAISSINKGTFTDAPVHGNNMHPGEILPLIICRVWDSALYGGKPTVNGQLFLDGPNVLWKTSVSLDADKTPGSWHWPVAAPKPGGDTLSRIGETLSGEKVALMRLEMRLRELCRVIEVCGASPQLTTASISASNARQVIAALIDQKPLSPDLAEWLENACIP